MSYHYCYFDSINPLKPITFLNKIFKGKYQLEKTEKANMSFTTEYLMQVLCSKP